MFSLIGLPPLAGFFGKYLVFLAAINANLFPLAVIGMLSSAVGAYYYLRIVKVMYFDEPKGTFEPMPGELKLVLGVAAAFVLLLIFMPSPLVDAASAAAKSLF
jgi:NADH-quinone oxidoreductase subunit N